ncbi:metallophosphoesterase family protein [Aquibium oceanicum]|uniref:Phosphoesterase n=1 Tax=Aquibium oceanicum TaxID=1670800 RepID=A0A1L3SNH7_9HYPH|nr:metallophosphoesterase family protein [Aquibium oceanicum]APH70977.1 YfcE family phosphodiesterase [Aquibium oceanicum]
MRIGVISDTHGLLRREALERLDGVDRIIHAGDVGSPDILPELEKIAPVTAIKGNVDTQAWADAIPETARVAFEGHAIFVIHDRKALGFDPAQEGIGVVICGHSHKPGIETVDGVLYLNPGSAGRRRFRLPVTVAILDLDAEGAVAHLHEIVGG